MGSAAGGHLASVALLRTRLSNLRAATSAVGLDHMADPMSWFCGWNDRPENGHGSGATRGPDMSHGLTAPSEQTLCFLPPARQVSRTITRFGRRGWAWNRPWSGAIFVRGPRAGQHQRRTRSNGVLHAAALDTPCLSGGAPGIGNFSIGDFGIGRVSTHTSHCLSRRRAWRLFRLAWHSAGREAGR
jgi:hypothetical protein